ncbi:MAG: hypothetical protein ACYCXC_17055, partial [Acidovorax defluvii]
MQGSIIKAHQGIRPAHPLIRFQVHHDSLKLHDTNQRLPPVIAARRRQAQCRKRQRRTNAAPATTQTPTAHRG